MFRKIIFWSHLFAGVSAGLAIFSTSFTGVVLMYEPQITEYFERNVRRVKPPPDNKRLTYDDLIAKVRTANPEARPAMIFDRVGSLRIGGRQYRARQHGFRKSLFGRAFGWLFGDSRIHAPGGRLAPLARRRRRRTRDCPLDYRRMQSGISLARRHRSLSLVAAQLDLARIED